MENFNLTDEEQRTFGEYFSNLDLDKQAKLSFKNVTQFLISYQLSDDDLEKIFNICGAKRLGHFGRSQFYIALKLVSLAQNQYELNLENLNKPNLPLPQRKLSSSILVNSSNSSDDKSRQINSIDSFLSLSSNTTGILPPPPSSSSKSNKSKDRLKHKLSPNFSQTTGTNSTNCKFCSKNLIPITTKSDQEQAKNLNTFVLICPNCKHLNQNSPPSIESQNQIRFLDTNLKNLGDQTSSSENSRCSSTVLYETIDDSNSLAFEKLKPWEKIESNQARDYTGLDDVDESKDCLLKDEEIDCATNKICLDINNYDQYDSNQPASYIYKNQTDFIEEEAEEDVWSMNDEQVKYYFNKFCELLPSKHDRLLAGCNVKSFFEKSKLSLNDLKQIWALSDLDSDGYLSLIEFCIAMHLVVLKRNKVPLPDKLPHSLAPNKINQLLVKNQLTLSSDNDKYQFSNTANSSLHSLDNHSLLIDSNYHLSSGIISINASNDNISNVSSTTSISLNQPQLTLMNSFDNDYIMNKAKVNSRNHQEPTNNSSSLLNSLNTTNSSGGLNKNYSLNTDNENIEHIKTTNSLNHEWTKFNNSPFMATNQFNQLSISSRHQNSNQQPQRLNNQINLQSNDVSSCLMTPANFDKIELDPTLIHPLPVKVSSLENPQQQQINLQMLNKDRTFKNTTVLNPPPYPPRPSRAGHARSSSLDLTRKMINNSNNFHPHGAFVNYRKHLQQQHNQNHNKPQFDLDTKNTSIFDNSSLDKQFFLNFIKNKYPLPKPLDMSTSNSTNLINSLKERNFVMECIYDKLIEELAGTLEQLSNYQKNNHKNLDLI